MERPRLLAEVSPFLVVYTVLACKYDTFNKAESFLIRAQFQPPVSGVPVVLEL